MPNDDAKAEAAVSESRCCTGSNSFEHHHTWTIKNFSFYKDDELLESSTFSARGYDNIKWSIGLYPSGKNEECRDFFSLFLRLESCDTSEVRVKFKFTILGIDQDLGEQEEDYSIFKSVKSWGYHKFIKKTEIFDRLHDLLGDELSVRCDMWAVFDTTNVPAHDSETPERTASAEFVRSIHDDDKAHERVADISLAAIDKNAPEKSSSTVETPHSSEESSIKLNNEEVSGLAAEAEKLQISDSVCDEIGSFPEGEFEQYDPGDHLQNQRETRFDNDSLGSESDSLSSTFSIISDR